MVRSGSTLQFNLAREILQASGQKVITAFQTPAEFVLDWEKGHYRDAQCILIKTHQTDISNVFRAGLEPLIAYIYRDLRDVYLSGKEKFGWKGESTLCRMLDKAVDGYKYIRTLPDDICLVQTYEQLFNDRKKSILDLAEFLSIDLPVAKVDGIHEHYSLDKIKAEIQSNKKQRIYLLYRKLERNIPRPIRGLLKKSRRLRDFKSQIRSNKVDSSTMFHADHISKRNGVPGQWKKHLNDGEIYLIETRYRNFLMDNNYI